MTAPEEALPDPSEALLGAAIPGSLVKLAVKLANAVQPIAMKYFRSDFVVHNKRDSSPVTIADKEAEAAMRALIQKTFPAHGIFGEEHGSHQSDAEYVWVLDPIDGTQAFVTGKPIFGTLIALLKEGAPVLGVMDMPALHERWVGALGRPTTFNGQPVTTRACADLSRAWLYATSPQMFPGADFDAFERLRLSCRRAVYGGECEAYGLLANGTVDLVCESTMQPYDYCALVPIVSGAGGVITDWQGRPLGMESDGRVLAAGDARMHAAAMRVLAG